MVRGAAVGASVLLLACAPDEFRYAGAGEQPCRSDGCEEPAAVCMDTWRTALYGVEARAIVVADEMIYVAGDTQRDGRAPAAWIGDFETCRGVAKIEHPEPIEDESSFGGAVRRLDDVVVVGRSQLAAAEPSGFLRALDTATLRNAWSLPIDGGGAALNGVALSDQTLWAVGTRAPATNPQSLAVRLLGDQIECSVAFATSPSELAAVALDGKSAFAAGSDGSAASLFRLGDDCQPAQSFVGLLPASATTARANALVVVAGTAYLAGATEAAGFLIAVDTTSGAISGNLSFDGAELTAIANAGQRLHFGGARGGVAVLGSVGLPLGPDTAPSFVHEIAGGERITALAADAPANAVYAAVWRADGAGSIVRCTGDGSCP